ncbi:cAMP-specific 3',5'-cyclic phosphodiesterase 4D-like [Astyanax mexicanus]|uniref:cAMP-specific 3',5'-cyclic phosphodiesterase 4D-like n=1 Tax=Astyanax mexicanus TaxID=7994 RepID=A0A8T2LQ52_ASTMX|nr:cAMP-specific 3',5'-cyclic phosphodiesterase 4D-like [Astyanax mexicanus]
MQENAGGGEMQIESVSDSSESPEACPLICMERLAARRPSCRTVQLPPLAFRLATQHYCDRRPETQTSQPRPSSLPLRTPPTINITSATDSRYFPLNTTPTTPTPTTPTPAASSKKPPPYQHHLRHRQQQIPPTENHTYAYVNHP